MNKEQIGTFVQEERKKQGLSQKALAAKAGIIRYQQIIEVEKCQRDFGISVLIKVLNALGYDLTFVQPNPLVQVRMVCQNTTFDFNKVEAAKEEKPEAPVIIPIYRKKVETPFKRKSKTKL